MTTFTTIPSHLHCYIVIPKHESSIYKELMRSEGWA